MPRYCLIITSTKSSPNQTLKPSQNSIPTFPSTTIYYYYNLTTMPQGTNASHAVGDSIVPQKLQEVLPQKVEEKVPNAIHDTGSGADTTGNAGVSHATGDSAVPKVAQEAVPKQAEKVLPEKVHPTN